MGSEHEMPRTEQSLEVSSEKSSNLEAPIERKVPNEDPAAIIESLRARLLSERSSSRAAKQQTKHLTKKVLELERSLEFEISERKKADEIIQELLEKLQQAGVKLDLSFASSKPVPSAQQDQQLVQPKPNWISKSISRRHSSDGSMDGSIFNTHNLAIAAADEDGEQNTQSDSPTSETGLMAPRRVGRSCRTFKRRDTSEEGIDEQVKGNWGRISREMTEISKLKDGVTEEEFSESWVSHVVGMFESKIDSSRDNLELLEDIKDDEPQSPPLKEEESWNDHQAASSEAEESINILQSSEHTKSESLQTSEAPKSESLQSVEAPESEVPSLIAEPQTDSQPEVEPQAYSEEAPSEGKPEVPLSSTSSRITESASVRRTDIGHQDSEVDEILLALRLAKQQLRPEQQHIPPDSQQCMYRSVPQSGYIPDSRPSLYIPDSRHSIYVPLADQGYKYLSQPYPKSEVLPVSGSHTSHGSHASFFSERLAQFTPMASRHDTPDFIPPSPQPAYIDRLKSIRYFTPTHF